MRAAFHDAIDAVWTGRSMMPLIADARDEIADFLDALSPSTSILIIAYILSSAVLLRSAGGCRTRAGRARCSGFLRDVSEPYLRIFRRFIPPIGPMDLSPIVAILVLQIVGGIIVSLIRG